jgi:predicted nucleic acid-binding protein
MAEGLTLVADSSAWIAFYRSSDSVMKELMMSAMRDHTILVPDVVLLEVLRGIDSAKQARAIELEFQHYGCVVVGGAQIAIQAAANYRKLRAKSLTVRGTIDLLIGTWCIANKTPLIHSDKDFIGFEKYLGLKVWRGDESSPNLA